MTVRVNGKPLELPAGLNVTGLIAHLGLTAQRVAVEVNLELAPRREWDTRVLQDGDRVEVVTFVGGG